MKPHITKRNGVWTCKGITGIARVGKNPEDAYDNLMMINKRDKWIIYALLASLVAYFVILMIKRGWL